MRQPFKYPEAVMFSQMPALRTMCLIHPAPLGAFLKEGADGQMLPAFCMLTQLTNLSLDQIHSPVRGLLGISILTGLRSFGWTQGDRDVPWDAISPLSSLECLTLGVPDVKRRMPVPDMTGLKVLELRCRVDEGCWNTLNRLTGINSIVKLTCWNSSYTPCVLSTLQAFTALQHLVITEVLPLRHVDWGTLVWLTGVTQLDIGYIPLYQPCTASCPSLLEAVTAMAQLACLKLSVRVDCIKTQVLNVLAALGTSFPGLVHLRELTVLYVVPQKWHIHTANLQSRWQALLKDTVVSVTRVPGLPVVPLHHYDSW